MSSPDFVHLHVHSEYSLLDGANKISDLVKACVADGQKAIALTDHGNMFGAIELYQACNKAGIKPILGCEVYVAKRSARLPHNRGDNGYHHLTLFARDEQGYRNLLALASAAYVDGYHVRPRIDKELLARHARGISCLSGCLSSEVISLCTMEREAEAEGIASSFRDLFGAEHFWLELQRNGIEKQVRGNEALVRMSERLGIPLIATNDIHYLRQEDCRTQDVLLCINVGAKRSDEKRFKMDTDTLFFRTREQMGHEFRDLPQTLAETMVAAEQVSLKIDFGKYHLPIFRSESGEDPELLFDRLCDQGLQRVYGPEHAAARERLRYEKKVIREMGFVSYFLIVWDLIRWARENGIPVGPGRGSAAGSIVAYALDITRVDPLRYDLLFERFLNSARISMPDIDIDFCMEGRGRVLEYTRNRYGSDHVAQIVTFGTMASRTAVRDVGRVLDVPLAEIDKIAKAMPAGPNAPSLEQAWEQNSELIALKHSRPDLAELFEFSTKLEGFVRHISTHAAGVVIADQPIQNYVPLATHDGEIVTQWSAPQLEQLGLLKMDYLGLRTLTILARTLENIRRTGLQPPVLETLALDDEATYKLMTSGDTLGVFQLESEGMRKLLARLKPDRFEDLIAVLALYRPGPLESGMDEMFSRRKHGLEAISYPHPTLEPILKDTYGCLVYQEQVMLISNVLGQFALNEADNLRKAMGKKQPEIMEQFSAKFIAGARQQGCAEQVAREIWDNIVKFGGYGFNKSHSTAYALITYQTAYLKAHHRTAFLAANMSCEMHSTDKVKTFVDDSRKAGITVLPPDSRHSVWTFAIEGDAIRFGFGAIKGTGSKAIDNLVAARADLKTPPVLHALCNAADPQEVTKLTWEALIKAGSFDWTGHNRGAVLAALDAAMSDGARTAADRRAGQPSLFADSAVALADALPRGDGIDSSKSSSKAETLRLEMEALGFYLSGHPLEERAGLFSMLSSCSTKQIAERAAGSEVVLAGLIVEKRESVVKSGNSQGQKMARFRLEDLEGGVQVTCFPRAYERYKSLIENDALVVVQAKLDDRSEEPALLLNEVYEIEQALARFEGEVVVYLTCEDEGKLEQLKTLLQRHRGRRPLRLLVLGADGRLRAVRSREGAAGITLTSNLAREVDNLLGRGRLRLGRG